MTTICRTNSNHTDMITDYIDRFETYSNGGYGLYIEGNASTENNRIAHTIATSLVARGVPVMVNTPSAMLDNISNAFTAGEEAVISTVKAYKEAEVLILTGLGDKHFTYDEIEVLYSVISARYEEMRPTIITTAYSAPELVEAIRPQGDDRCMSRAIVNRLQSTAVALSA